MYIGQMFIKIKKLKYVKIDFKDVKIKLYE